LLVIVPRRLRAPQQNGGVFAEPPLVDVGRLLADNRRKLSAYAPGIFGRPWADLRRLARRAAVQAARDYLRNAGEPVPVGGDASLLLAGHQPELFHPGVWVKNFAFHRLGQAHGVTPINLIVDNDTAKSTSLRLPALAANHDLVAHVASVPFDHWTGEVPYEERAVQDESLFASLPERVATLIEDWGFVPLLAAFWEEVRAQTGRTHLLGERLVAARRAFERRWGCHNLELPVSALCRTEGFAWFACHLLANLPRFHAAYNACVHDYRRLYGIRSRNHPVPDLTAESGWLEVPLWAWRAGQARRGRLMARHSESAVELRAGDDHWPPLPWKTDGDAHEMVLAWQRLEGHGLKVRSRALTNTLFARLLLADLFVHGIGGAKYDELTDEIIRRFYGCDPPGYLVLSATLLLPLPELPARPATLVQLARELRDLRYNPQRHLPEVTLASPSVHELVEQKEAWIARQPSDAPQRRQRFEALRALTEQLRAYVNVREKSAERELVDCNRRLAVKAVLQRRDYAFCLYPETVLRPFCSRFLFG
jgi:hypothetical protein